MIKIAIACDHAGFDLKQQLLEDVLAPYAIKDFGTDSTNSMDYPDVVHPLARAVESGEYDFGILICGSGNGVAITANKYKGIRAALCWNEELGKLARQHNNANVLCLPARFITKEAAVGICEAFLKTEFEGGRHQNRVSKIAPTC
jgi:ribose 5-phosphate isomerase B